MVDRPPIRYFDHAATSWPKPPVVTAAMVAALETASGNPGRGAHRLALEAERVIAAARSSLAGLLGVADERDLAFVPGCTYALNLVLKGLLAPGDRVVVSSVEHNAVTRPLAALATGGVNVVTVPADAEGHVDPDDVERAVAAERTAAVVCQHASNVSGVIQPVGDLADIAHEHGALMVVDGAQAAGHLDIDLAALGADAYVVPGHKGLLGPQGIGAVYLSPGCEPHGLVQGGGGRDSAAAAQVSERPDRYEAGTPNVPGIAGLGAAAELLRAEGPAIRAAERRLARRLHEAVAAMPAFRVLGPPVLEERVPVVTVVHATRAPDEIAFELERLAGIAVRAGLHCSPWTHQALGTFETGAVRLSVGWGLTDEDVDVVLESLAALGG
jgi:cysteine desulfurase family protein